MGNQIKKSLGGDRLGSGKKMDVWMHNYERSTHDIGRIFRSSMTSGVLVPFLVDINLNGDTWDIDLNTLIRTIPTIGPLYGSYKLQADIFTADMRLYNRQLHNNKLNIGRNMEKVIFPQIVLEGTNVVAGIDTEETAQLAQIHPSSLMAYLGIRGLGRLDGGTTTDKVTRTTNAMFELMYYDIFKNYYANKQEETAFAIGTAIVSKDNSQGSVKGVMMADGQTDFENLNIVNGDIIDLYTDKLYAHDISVYRYYNGAYQYVDTADNIFTVIFEAYGDYSAEFPGANIYMSLRSNGMAGQLRFQPEVISLTKEVSIIPFELENIDQMREDILGAPTTEPFIIDRTSLRPYSIPCERQSDVNPAYELHGTMSALPMGGLCLKTYQSDRFNNWLNEEWIEGEGGVKEVTAIDVSDGTLDLDTLNIAQKVYNMLNRICASGGSYIDWQDVVYGSSMNESAESPIFQGGISQEIVFNEVVSTADTTENGYNDGYTVGDLAGKGNAVSKKGGTIRIKRDCPCMVMGIVSITPRIDYSQGNKWFTRLQTMNDLHKPELDGIGFQELITDEMAWFDTILDADGNPTYKSAGLQPSWIEYMTSQNEVYGDFALQNNSMFMVLNRNYTFGEDGIDDLTTYIDPSKYNYSFADTSLEAQNFWVQIAADITIRRKISAKVIPNL